MQVDIDELTLGELEWVERYTGLPAERWRAVMADPAACKARLLTALTFIAGRAADPSFTLEMARRVKPGSE